MKRRPRAEKTFRPVESFLPLALNTDQSEAVLQNLSWQRSFVSFQMSGRFQFRTRGSKDGDPVVLVRSLESVRDIVRPQVISTCHLGS